MSAYRFYDPAPVFFDTTGVEKVVNGKLTFYEIGTTTNKNTWSDADLMILNSNPVLCDSSGRTNVNIFLDGDYSVKIEADNLSPITRDIISGAVSGQTIPALDSGEFLTNDGANLLWQAIRQMPDPTGSSGQVPVTNGVGYVLQNLATFPVVITASSIKITSGGVNWMIQWGSDTVAASGNTTALKAVNFPTVFTTLYHVDASINGSSGVANPGGGIPSSGCSARTTAGFSFALDTNAFGADIDILNPVPFSWMAIGLVA